MTPAQQREEALFEAALAKPLAERAAFLDGACHADPALRVRLEALLEEHEQPDGLLAKPADPDRPTLKIQSPQHSPDETVGQMLGPYKLREKIGEGGCGVVYVAEQEKPVRRRVALKVIKLGMDTRSVIARFEAERQALAMMDHPSIAKVLDAGATEAGRPYFVMELVRGIRITDYCDQNNLSTKDRLGLFTKVCHAIQHAHQKGIIHRDIKPSNILVTLHDGVPVPKVIDFGIAKATEGRLSDLTVYTEMHQFIGTPAYMSPEQAEMSGLDIDTRSDIYALGVLLYELLTGQTPFDATKLVQSGLDEIRRTIREVEPPKPSTRLSTMLNADLTLVAKRHGAEPSKFSRRVRGDLDWIVMTCLEKDRTRRYETANGLATDIQRHLNNEPIRACPPSTVYRLQKLMRRNKLGFAAGTAVAASLVIGIAVSQWQAVRATNAEKKTAAERDKKEEARKSAEDISKFLIQVFRSPDPARDGRTITVAETLDTAAKKLNTDISTRFGQRAMLQATLGHTYHALGLYREAIPLQEKARDYYLAKYGPKSSDTLDAMHCLAISYCGAGRLNEAIQLAEEVLAHRRKAIGPEHIDTLRAMECLGSYYANAGRRDEALKLREEVLALRRKVLGPEHPETISAIHNLGNSYDHFGRKDEVLKLREDVLALRRKVNGPEHPDTLKAIHGLGSAYADAGREDEALKLREEELTLSRKVLGPGHHDTLMVMMDVSKAYSQTKPDEALKMREETLAGLRKVDGPENQWTIRALFNLSLSWRDAGRLDEAIKMQEEALPLFRKVLGPEHSTTLKAMTEVAISYAAAGRHDEALKLREELLPLSRKVNGPEDRDTLGAMTNLAFTYGKTGRLKEAVTLQEQALAIKRRVLRPNDSYLASALASMAYLYEKTGRKEEALKLHEEELAGLRKMSGPENRSTLKAMQNLSRFYRDAGHREDALKMGEETLQLMRKVLGPEHHDTLEAMTQLALSYSDAGRHDEALQLVETALPLFRKVLGPEHRDTLGTMSNLAISYRKTGRIAEGISLQEQSLAIKRRVLRPDHPFIAVALDNLADLYSDTGRNDESLKLREELLTFRRKVNGLEHARTLGAMSDLADAYSETGRSDTELKLREELLTLSRKVNGLENSGPLQGLAWMLIMCRDTALRNPKRAVELATQAVELRPESAICVGTLGTAQYRAGENATAIPILQKALSLAREHHRADASAIFGFFLAMARWQAGDKDQAGKDYNQAVVSMEMAKGKSKFTDDEMLRTKEEAAVLLMPPGDSLKKAGP